MPVLCPGRHHGKNEVMRKVECRRVWHARMLEKKGGTEHEDPCEPRKELPFLNSESSGKLLKCLKHIHAYRVSCSDLCFEILTFTVVQC